MKRLLKWVACEAIGVVMLASQALALTPAEQRMVARAEPHLPSVYAALTEVWPEMPIPSFLAAQIEQESLWNPRAELKTKREYGFGFGQLTITSRFNAFEEVKALHPKLRGWDYEDRFDPARQILAVVVKDRFHYRQCAPLMRNDVGRMACVASSYNGGFGGFQADRRLCANTAGCDPTAWFGHVAKTSLKQKSRVVGYGKSFYEINREYVDYTVLRDKRRAKYLPYFGGL